MSWKFIGPIGLLLFFGLNQHIWDYVYTYIYIYIDILHVNLKCYLLTHICQMVLLKHCKYLFSIWFSAFFWGVPCIYICIYSFYISICSADRNRATMLSSDRTRDDCANSRLPGPGWWAYTAKYQCGSIMFDIIYIYIYTHYCTVIYVHCTYNIYIYTHTV